MENNNECRFNHNPNDIDNSLRMLNKQEFDKFPIYFFYCTECNHMFSFKRNVNGSFEYIE